MSFRQKMVLVMVWLLTLSYGVGGILLMRQNFQSSLTQSQSNAEESYEMILKSIQLVNLVDIQQDFSNISNTLDRMNSSDSVVGISLKRGNKDLYNYGEAVEEEDVKSTAEFSSLMFSRDTRHLYQISGELKTNGKPLELVVVYDISPVFLSRDEQIRTYHQVLIVLLVIGGITAWLTAFLMTKPLVKVSKTARALSTGNLEARVNPKTHDELGQLGSDFDFMAEKLSDNINEMKMTMEHQEMFMGSFAHELKTPMTSIIGYADLIRSDALGPEESREAANYIFSEGKRLEALSFKLHDLLMMRNQKLNLVPTDMKHMIENLTFHLQPVYRKRNIDLQCRCEPALCMCEPDLFGSVIANLVDNSRKAMDRGGNIMIMGNSVNGDYRIRVIDNGRGMPEEAIRHITFESAGWCRSRLDFV